MTIPFNLIPVDIRVPGVYVEVDNSRAVRGLAGVPTRILVIGQMLATGTAPPLTPLRITGTDQAQQFFGRGSMLAHQLEQLRGSNSFTETWAVAVQDTTAGVAAQAKVTVTGPATAAGTLTLYIGGRRVRIAVATGDKADQIAAALQTAIADDSDLPATAVVNNVDSSQLDLAARHKGEAGNALDLRTAYYESDRLPAGVGVTLTAFSGGTGNPEIAEVIAVLGDEWYTDIVMPWTDGANLAALEVELADRFGPLRMIDAHAYAGAAGTLASLTTLGESRNSPHLTIIGATESPTPPWEWAAVLAAQCAFHGRQDPARPFQTLPLTGLLAPATEDLPTLQERNLLLYDGVATWRVEAGGTVVIERVITTYKETAFGAQDPSYLDLNTLKTLTALRYDLRTDIARTFPRHKLAGDDVQVRQGAAIVTPKIVRAHIIARFRQWQEAGWVEGIDQFKRDLVVERDANDPTRLNALVPPDIINQLRVFAGLLQFRL